MEQRRWGQKGFSLVEVSVASVIVASMGLVLAAVLRTETQGWQVRENQMTTSFELRRGIHAMVRELAQTRIDQLQVLVGGAWVPMPADGNFYISIQFRVPQVVAPNTTVLDATGAVTWSPNPITYALGGVNGQELQRTQTGVTSATLAYGVTALNFRRQAATPSVLEMNMTVQRGAANGGFIHQGTLSTRVRLRQP